MKTVRLTAAQALVRYLAHQYVERDGVRHRFFYGVFGIFGHGNLAGIGQALQEEPAVRFVPFRNEQAAVHAAVAFARMKNRLGACACTSSIGPGATNMVTGAALATINRLPVLLLPGDIFAGRNVAPVLQQLEDERSMDVSVNDCFKPVSRYFDRINRPDQLVWALPQAMRTLTSPAMTGAVTLAMPQDVQTEAYDFPAGLFEDRVWHIPRPRPDREALGRAATLVRSSQRPLLIAGGGVIYSDATSALAAFARATGVPVAATQAGNGALPWNDPVWVGAVGVTGNAAANALAAKADVVIGVGTRYSDFTTASQTAFRNPVVEFVNINICEMDSFKEGGCSIVGDARVGLEELCALLEGWRVSDSYASEVARLKSAWMEERTRLVAPSQKGLLSQAEVIGVLDAFVGSTDVIVNAAGSAPGDLHKLWRPRDPKQYHVEYGYSCMGYEVPGGVGVKMAAPEREVYVLCGDGSWLMMSSDLVTAIQEGLKITVVLVDNHGFASIGGLSASVGSGGFGTEHRSRGNDGMLSGTILPIDFVANAASLGAAAVKAKNLEEFRGALEQARKGVQTSVIVVECDRSARVPAYGTWWDVAVAQTASMDTVRQARKRYEFERARERCIHGESRRPRLRVANAPCSWGVLEFDPQSRMTSVERVLLEMREAGYEGTELGDYGFMPTEPEALRELLVKYGLEMVGAFVPVAFADPAAHEAGVRAAVRTARLLAAVASRPVVVLSDDNGKVPHRKAHAGRIRPDEGLRPEEMDVFARGVELVARAVLEETGLQSVFHNHCAGWIETPDEVSALMDRTDPKLVGLCLDTGHYAFGGGDPMDALVGYGGRIRHVHFKDHSPELARQAAQEGWDYDESVRRGRFCELGHGEVQFNRIVEALARIGYEGWVVVEQDVLPGLGTPFESAKRNREFLTRLGI